MRTIVKLLLLPALGVLFAGIAPRAGLVDFSASKTRSEEVWQLVAALRQLPRLSPEVRHRLGKER